MNHYELDALSFFLCLLLNMLQLLLHCWLPMPRPLSIDLLT